MLTKQTNPHLPSIEIVIVDYKSFFWSKEKRRLVNNAIITGGLASIITSLLYFTPSFLPAETGTFTFYMHMYKLLCLLFRNFELFLSVRLLMFCRGYREQTAANCSQSQDESWCERCWLPLITGLRLDSSRLCIVYDDLPKTNNTQRPKISIPPLLTPCEVKRVWNQIMDNCRNFLLFIIFLLRLFL